MEDNVLLKEAIADKLGVEDLNRIFLLISRLTKLDLGTRLSFIVGSRLLEKKWDMIDDDVKLEVIGQLGLAGYTSQHLKEFMYFFTLKI